MCVNVFDARFVLKDNEYGFNSKQNNNNNNNKTLVELKHIALRVSHNFMTQFCIQLSDKVR